MSKPARFKNVTASPNHVFLGGSGSGGIMAAKTAENLHQAFEGLGLTPYQARVLVALLQAGPANCLELARIAGIPRTSIYQILDELGARGVASRLPGNGPAIWASVGRNEVFAGLVASEEERLNELKARSARLAETLDELLPADRSTSLPYVHVIHDPSRVSPLYEQLLAQTEDELLVFNRPPYSKNIGSPKEAVVGAIRRGDAKVLYQSAEAEGPYYDAWHREMEAYHEAGAEGRVVDTLPMKLAVFDRKVAMLSLDDPLVPQVGFPITLLIEHAGYASVQAAAFDQLWSTAVPYEEVRPGRLGNVADLA